jgi:hypothetical protein
MRRGAIFVMKSFIIHNPSQIISVARTWCGVCVSTIMTLQAPLKAENFLTS